MQMTTNEKLERIAARCRELLALAENRTRGKWTWNRDVLTDEDGGIICDATTYSGEDFAWMRNNAVFAGACAGPAEAGWRATLAAIATFSAQAEVQKLVGITESSATDTINDIIAAWEGLGLWT